MGGVTALLCATITSIFIGVMVSAGMGILTHLPFQSAGN